ncbi:hypothetical protein HQ545_09000 [Candidatus Woesearchaeota archaeon]|nr:hypothetical protein [Candidatus Woesearchaeota archaeon]
MKPVTAITDSKNCQAFVFVQNAIDMRKTRNRPFVIGITGAGGAGKTTFGKNIAEYYGCESCISIDLDDYLIPRDIRGKLGLTGYDPRANKLNLARENIEDLLNNKTIVKPCYDHSTGNVVTNETVTPKELVIIEGVTTLYPALKNLCGVSFFLDALEETQIKSRIERDVKTRGYSLEEAMILYESLKPMYSKHIAPTKEFASVVFQVSTDYVMRPVYVHDSLR